MSRKSKTTQPNVKITQDNYTPRIECRQLEIHTLQATQGYQRQQLNNAVISKIVKEFDPLRLGVLKVSDRRGKYYVVDGQHRLTALLVLHPHDKYFVWCEVQSGLTYESEAMGFVAQDENKTPVNSYQKFNALLEAKDRDALAVNEAVTRAGFRMAKVPTCNTDRVIKCIDKIRRIHKKHDEVFLFDILHLIGQTWGGDAASLENQVVGGVSLFYETYENEFNQERFIRTLGNMKPKEIIINGRADISTTGDLRFAKVIWLKYNTGRKQGQLPYNFKG